MNRSEDRPAVLMSPVARLIWGIMLIVLAAGALTGAALVAFTVGGGQSDRNAVLNNTEGWPKTVGRVCGLLAATLVFIQFALSSKLKVLDRIFGLHRLLFSHRTVGLCLVILASLHPLFMFAPADSRIGPLRFSIWPKLLGVLLLIGLWTAVCSARWREFLGLPYQKWYRWHRPVMFAAVMIVGLHAWNVTDDFHRGWPFYGLVAALGLYAALFIRINVFKPLILNRRLYTVTQANPAGRAAYSIELTPAKGKVFSYVPGQFAFVTFICASLPVERHHWTISSTPTRPESLMFTIKCSGDFTALLGRLKPGDRAMIDGPYGHFSHLASGCDPGEEIVMIAGGIGMTPMLSMLRYMQDIGDQRKITLVWSNRTEADILCREELENMRGTLPNLTIYHVLSRQKNFQGSTGRLSNQMLAEFLAVCNRKAAVFLCGPPPMMKGVFRDLKGLGFKPYRIFTEKFSY